MISKLQNGRTINYSGINKNTIANLKYIDNALIKAGYGYIQRLAILGNVQRESGGNPLAVSSNGLWHGIIQWDKDRYRIQSNNEQEELQRQTNLLLNELEKKGWSGATWKDQLSYAKSFKDTTDLKQAVDIFTRRFVRPGDIEGEIKKRLAFAQSGFVEQEDPEYDLETAKRVLPKNLINAWQKNPEKNHLPSGYTDEKGNWRALKSIYHPSWKDELKRQSSPDNMNEMLKYGYPENYVSKFLVYKPSGKYQKGGLIYKPFFQETEETNNENNDSLTYSSYNYILDDWNPSYPVEPVKIYNPTISLISSENKSYTPEEKQEESEEPIVENNTSSPIEETLETVTPGIVSYARRNIDVGNMQEWIDLATKEGVSFTIYSGVRPNAMTKSGHRSNHAIGKALDIGPGKGQTFADLKRQILASPKLVAFMKEKGIGIINETIPEVMRQTGATGPHFHVGPDQWGLQHFERWLRNEKENLHKL